MNYARFCRARLLAPALAAANSHRHARFHELAAREAIKDGAVRRHSVCCHALLIVACAGLVTTMYRRTLMSG